MIRRYKRKLREVEDELVSLKEITALAAHEEFLYREVESQRKLRESRREADEQADRNRENTRVQVLMHDETVKTFKASRWLQGDGGSLRVLQIRGTDHNGSRVQIAELAPGSWESVVLTEEISDD